MITYQQYTKKDLCDWLNTGMDNGLNEIAISHVRAWSLIHCPDAHDDDVMVVVAKDVDKVVGFTAVFPEKLVQPNLWVAVGTTLWADPDYKGEFVGYELVKKLWQAYPDHLMLGSDVTPTAAMIDKLLGAKIEKLVRRRYVLRRTIEICSVRNLASWLIEPYRILRQKKRFNRTTMHCDSIRVEYCTHIDEQAYQFMATHSDGNQILRSKDMLNWWITYPFLIENPDILPTTLQNSFAGNIKEDKRWILKVYNNAELIGVTMLAMRNKVMRVLLLYNMDENAEYVYQTVINFTWRIGAMQLYSIYKSLNDYMDKLGVELKQYKESFFWTYVNTYPWNKDLYLQGSDGDMFV